MGCCFSGNNKIEDISSTSTDSDISAGGLKQKLFQIPQNPIQYANQPPSVQKYINPTRYKRDEEVYINRFVTTISFSDSGGIRNFWGQ